MKPFKLASDLAKPDGFRVIRAEELPQALAPLEIERMWGVGPKTAPKFRALSIHTFGDLAKADEAWLTRALGPWALEVADLARGIDREHLAAVRLHRDSRLPGCIGEPFGDSIRDQCLNRTCTGSHHQQRNRLHDRIVLTRVGHGTLADAASWAVSRRQP